MPIRVKSLRAEGLAIPAFSKLKYVLLKEDGLLRGPQKCLKQIFIYEHM